MSAPAILNELFAAAITARGSSEKKTVSIRQPGAELRRIANLFKTASCWPSIWPLLRQAGEWSASVDQDWLVLLVCPLSRKSHTSRADFTEALFTPCRPAARLLPLAVCVNITESCEGVSRFGNVWRLCGGRWLWLSGYFIVSMTRHTSLWRHASLLLLLACSLRHLWGRVRGGAARRHDARAVATTFWPHG